MLCFICRKRQRHCRTKGKIFTLTGEEVMDNRTTVFIADGAEEFCSGLSAALLQTDTFLVAGTAGDGEQTIRMVQQLRPDILVLDLMLSKQDGLSVMKAVSTMEKRPVIMATS